jgi:holin-like protein
MAVALSRVTPAVVQRLQVPVQVLLYAGLFVFAEYLVGWLHLPLPANLVGMVLMLTLILCRVFPLTGCAPARAGCWRRCCCSLFRRWWRW